MVPKYPRIPHLPWSPGETSDDRRLSNVMPFIDVPVVITEKMDGSNLCMTPEGVYARTHAHPPAHSSFNRAKALWAALKSRLRPGKSVFGEWCYAKHSIAYDALPGYFLVFGVRIEDESRWLSWADTKLCAEELKLPTVPELWSGTSVNEPVLMRRVHEALVTTSAVGGDREGVVVRLEGSIAEFESSVAKWVRAGHVQTDEHWRVGPIIENRLSPHCR